MSPYKRTIKVWCNRVFGRKRGQSFGNRILVRGNKLSTSIVRMHAPWVFYMCCFSSTRKSIYFVTDCYSSCAHSSNWLGYLSIWISKKVCWWTIFRGQKKRVLIDEATWDDSNRFRNEFLWLSKYALESGTYPDWRREL